MNTITELFTKQLRGYNERQVDSYIQMLAGEYDKLQKQYEELSNQYEFLTAQATAKMEVISKVLVQAETSADQIIENAKDEAERLTANARTEFANLQRYKAAVIAEISGIASRLHGLAPAAV